MHAPDPLALVGRTIADKYQIERFVSEGGFAVVYRAMHTIWRLPVAIKLFNALSLAPGEQQRELELAFINEGALLTRLSAQTNAIVQARDIGSYETPDGSRIPFLVLEWVDGSPLDQVLEVERSARKKPWTLREVRRFLAPICAAVDVVHEHGVAHRDLKPANILVVGGNPRSGEAGVKILDFGVAKMMLDNSRFQAALAVTGRAVTAFTPHYGAPEQFSRRYGATGPWTDVYALALIAVEMLAGREALGGADVVELSAASTNGRRRPTPRSLGIDVPDGVEAVFAKALAVHPEQRFARAREFWAAFDGALEGSTGAAFESVRPAPAAPGSVAPPPLRDPSSTGAGTRIAIAAAIAGALLVVVALGAASLLARRATKQPEPLTSAAPDRPEPPSPAQSAAVPAPRGCPSGAVQFAAAEYFMGSDHQHSPANERPAHQVALSPFCLDQREVTVARYKACADAGKCREAPVGVTWQNITKKERILFGATCNAQYKDRAEHPMNCIDWKLAESFCKASNGHLPSEAQWEFAARGPNVTRYPWGDAAPDATLLNACDVACQRWGQRNDIPVRTLFDQLDKWPTTAPAGSFARGRSRLNLDDIAGNVREWTADWYGPYPVERQSDPSGAASGEERVVRGSSWMTGDSAELPRSFRGAEAPSARRPDLGFRCAYGL
jgi:eukaryotic-like serine/threonine-protein kinase